MIFIPPTHYSDYQIKGDETDGARGKYGRNACKIFLGKTEETRRPFTRSWCRWKSNITTDFKATVQKGVKSMHLA
jgi:hypothetical protein